MSRLQVGLKVGRWLLLERTVMTKRAKWLARCECGVEKEVAASSLLSNKSLSCGCLRAEQMTESNLTHGGSKTYLYRVWAAMKDRCDNPRDKHYADYGGRGIKVCRRWLSFENFKADVGDRPSDQHMLERRENDRGYTPSNVVWATRTQQARNRRSNRVLTYRGRSQCLSAWAEELGMSVVMLSDRINKQGLSVEEAFTRPPRYKGSV